jgi:hypothetical protein
MCRDLHDCRGTVAAVRVGPHGRVPDSRSPEYRRPRRTMTIAGDWYNELGSHMELTPDASGGITGTYLSATGHAKGRYLLVGRYDAPNLPDYGTALGWTVAWSNERNDADSVTGWNGLYQDDGAERILATWLLTRAATAQDAWDSTTIGQDVFTREAPDPGRIEDHLRLGRPVSHPQSPATARPE